MSTESIVKSLLNGNAEYVSGDEFSINALLAQPSPVTGIPTTLPELNRQVVRTYDLSVTAAGNLSIPIVASVSGGFNRRVIVLERAAYKDVPEGDITYQYGYAVRLAITVNKVTADMKLTLPFMAASAEVGHVEGKWTLHVVGLAGAKIDAAILPPTELNVETFVLAKQSLTALINAVHDTKTTFTAAQIGVKKPAGMIEREYQIAVGRAYALGRIHKGRNLGKALSELDTVSDTMKDTITDTYKEFAGIANDTSKPSDSVRTKAQATLGDVKVEPR